MNFYQQQISSLNKKLYPKEYITAQLVQSKQFIDLHFTENICLDTICAKAFISKFYFIRLFKQYYGCTPHNYLTTKRIAHAKQLLRQGHDVKTVCMLCGFDSKTSFSGLYKKITGCTPATDRKKAISKN
jgi:AraC-like DNA-binding protein